MRLGHGRPVFRAALLLAVLLSSAGTVSADWLKLPDLFGKREEAPEPPPTFEERHWRAGYPLCTSRWAAFTYGPKYTGYYVGGDSAFGGEARYRNEGTWGVDYAPWYSRVMLGWSHGRRYQGGGGQYESDRKNRPLKPGLER